MITERDLVIAMLAFFAGGAALNADRDRRLWCLGYLGFGVFCWLATLLP